METGGFDSYIFVYSCGSSCREASELAFLLITCEVLSEVDHLVLHQVVGGYDLRFARALLKRSTMSIDHGRQQDLTAKGLPYVAVSRLKK
jgi:hypothetical protein